MKKDERNNKERVREWQIIKSVSTHKVNDIDICIPNKCLVERRQGHELGTTHPWFLPCFLGGTH